MKAMIPGTVKSFGRSSLNHLVGRDVAEIGSRGFCGQVEKLLIRSMNSCAAVGCGFQVARRRSRSFRPPPGPPAPAKEVGHCDVGVARGRLATISCWCCFIGVEGNALRRLRDAKHRPLSSLGRKPLGIWNEQVRGHAHHRQGRRGGSRTDAAARRCRLQS